MTTEAVERFLSVSCDGNGYGSGNGNGYGYGNGYGSGSGYGSGNGYGYGSGDGYGYGNGYGSGSGYGSGNGYGYGSGYGSGYGYGSCDGSGYGYGSCDGSGIVMMCGQRVYAIDGVPTILHRIRAGLASGWIVRADLSLAPCYVAKAGDHFAHGETASDAVRDARLKALEDATDEERIERFLSEFGKCNRISASKLFDAHGWLTGSCEMGRKQFVHDHSIDMNAMLSIPEFIALTKNEYGGEIIRMLEEHYK